MGLSMNHDIHSPTAVADIDTSAELGSLRERWSKWSIPELAAEKDRHQAELDNLCAVLDSQKARLNSSVLTFDGFPRDDISVTVVRTTQSKIHRLLSNKNVLMEVMQEAVDREFARLRENESSAAQSASGSSTVPLGESSTDALDEIPFCRVTNVNDGSPAWAAGLKVGDRIKNFGGVNYTFHGAMGELAVRLRRNEGKRVPVRVERKSENGLGDEQVTVHLIPRKWREGDPSLLGCTLNPEG